MEISKDSVGIVGIWVVDRLGKLLINSRFFVFLPKLSIGFERVGGFRYTDVCTWYVGVMGVENGKKKHTQLKPSRGPVSVGFSQSKLHVEIGGFGT